MNEAECFNLGCEIARHIFSIGSEPDSHGGPCHRIVFMGGEWPNSEVQMGGLCENALANVISSYLQAKEQANDSMAELRQKPSRQS